MSHGQNNPVILYLWVSKKTHSYMDLHDWCEHIMTGVCILLGNASNLPLSQSFELNRVLSVLHIILYIAVILLSYIF